MGKPEDVEDFERFEAGDITIYISRELLERQEPGTGWVPFYIDGYGKFRLQLRGAGDLT